MYRLDMYPGASLLRTLYMNKPLLYSSCFCRLIRERERVRVRVCVCECVCVGRTRISHMQTGAFVCHLMLLIFNSFFFFSLRC